MNSKMIKGMDEANGGITRRAFLGAGAAGGAALLSGGFSSVVQAAAQVDGGPPIWLEKSIPQLQSLMKTGRLSSRELTKGYLRRIERLNPLVAAVIETNPHAIDVATRRDEERRAGFIRGPLHGIPVLLKDNIAFIGAMETTAGSLALEGSKVPADATVAGRLRQEGAVILGKANLSEWANFRGFAPFNGWSARGGFTRDPYRLDFDPCGSSSGSAVAPALNLCAGAVGSETDGSIVCPSGNNLVVGLKPTLGLLSGDGIIPIAHSQDTAGPMCRTVTDAAILLGADAVARCTGRRKCLAEELPTVLAARFTRRQAHRRRSALLHAGLWRRAGPGGGSPAGHRRDGEPRGHDSPSRHRRFVRVLRREFTVLLFEFKVQIAEYLAGLKHTSMRTLTDLIDFNATHCAEEMRYFGQELFEMAEETSGDLNDPVYSDARALCLRSDAR